MKGGRGNRVKAAAIRFWCPNKAQVGVPGLFICRFSFFRALTDWPACALKRLTKPFNCSSGNGSVH